MKKIFQTTFLLLAITTGMYNCTNHSSADENAAAPLANGASASDNSLMESGAATIDVNAKSNSKGIGRFTDVKTGPISTELANKGAQVFDLKCSACHKTTDEKLVGPGLKGVTEIRTPEWIMNMITNAPEMTQKDPIAKALLEQNLTQMSVQVTDEEARQVLEFLRKNDAGQQ